MPQHSRSLTSRPALLRCPPVFPCSKNLTHPNIVQCFDFAFQIFQVEPARLLAHLPARMPAHPSARLPACLPSGLTALYA